jgi:hypothetical protein
MLVADGDGGVPVGDGGLKTMLNVGFWILNFGLGRGEA